MGTIAIAVGSATHTAFWLDEEGVEHSLLCANTVSGVDELIALDPERIFFAGNRRWVISFAYALRAGLGEEFPVRYLPRPKMARGRAA